jgi:hypothetical protein
MHICSYYAPGAASYYSYCVCAYMIRSRARRARARRIRDPAALLPYAALAALAGCELRWLRLPPAGRWLLAACWSCSVYLARAVFGAASILSKPINSSYYPKHTYSTTQ